MESDLCPICNSENFDHRGVALTKGVKVFKCRSCGQDSMNYAKGQDIFCHECSRNWEVCVMCGRVLND